MSDEIWKRDEVQSPCVKTCVIHPAARICVGCLRSIEEISRWGAMSGAERSAVLEALPLRAGTLTKRRGGRMGRLAD